MKQRYKLRFLPSFFKETDDIVYYISSILQNVVSADRLIDELEKAIYERLSSPETFPLYLSKRDRKYPYYKIRVKNYIVFYVILEENGEKIMEVRHLYYGRRDLENLL